MKIQKQKFPSGSSPANNSSAPTKFTNFVRHHIYLYIYIYILMCGALPPTLLERCVDMFALMVRKSQILGSDACTTSGGGRRSEIFCDVGGQNRDISAPRQRDVRDLGARSRLVGGIVAAWSTKRGAWSVAIIAKCEILEQKVGSSEVSEHGCGHFSIFL